MDTRRWLAFAAFALASLAPVTASASIKSADAAGRYAVMREDKDTGCMLTLDLRARGPGGNKALLAPACRDNGIVVFDPVGWTLDRDRLVQMGFSRLIERVIQERTGGYK